MLLFFLGSYDRRQVDTNSRLQAYSQQDFDLLVQVLNRFRLLITTPHILTEVSNLSSAISERDREAYFRAIASHLTLLDEQRVASQVCLNSRWARFGLTDAAIATIAKKKYLVITDDFRLSQSLQNDGIDALNFNHLRQAYWQMSN
jgi:predicted nucleic acid-binding protein